MESNMDELKQIILSVKSESIGPTVRLLTKCLANKENEKIIVSNVNRLLSSTKTRTFGLELLNSLMVQLSEDVLNENAFQWINYCVFLKNEDVSVLKLEVLEKLIGIIGKTERFGKKFTSEYLLNIVKICLSHQNEAEMGGVLKCLCQCMKYYPSWFINYKEEVQSFLIKFIENPSGNHIQQAAVAFHYFLQTGGSGHEGINYVNNFQNGFKKLCNTVMHLYSFFPEHFGDAGNNDEEVFTLSSLPSDSEDSKIWEVVAGRIINCLVFIKTLIEKKFPFEKQITPKQIKTIFIHGFKRHCCILEDNSSLIQKQSLLLTEIQMKLLRVLQVFVISNTAGFLPFTYVTVKYFFIILEKCNNCIYCTNNFHYKEQLYKTITTLLQRGNAVNHPHFQEVLTSFLLKDIDSDKDQTSVLNLNSTEKKIETLQKSSCSAHTTQKKTCSLALNTLKCLLEIYPLKISKTHWQELVTSIIQHLNNSHSNDLRAVNLYQILTLLLKQEYGEYTPTMHTIISILNRGLNSVDHRIRTAAREGLDAIELMSQSVCSSLFIYHPVMPTVLDNIKNIDYETTTVSNSFDENINSISDESNKINGSNKIHILSDIKITVNEKTDIEVINVSEEADEVINVNKRTNGEVVDSVSEHSCVEENERNVGLPQDDVSNIQTRNKELMESESEQPPQKKMKPNDQVLNMMDSFQDEVQS